MVCTQSVSVLVSLSVEYVLRYTVSVAEELYNYFGCGEFVTEQL